LRTRLLSIGNKLWENHDFTLQLVITYIYLFERISASRLSYFSNSPSVMHQKLNWNVTQALEKTFTIGILSYTDSWSLVPFSSNVSWDCTESGSVFWLRDWQQFRIISHQTWHNSWQQDTQQEYSYTNLADTHLLPVTATQGRVKEASHWNVTVKALYTARFFRRKWVSCKE